MTSLCYTFSPEATETLSFASVRKGSSNHGCGIAIFHDVEEENENPEVNENNERETAFCHFVDPCHYSPAPLPSCQLASSCSLLQIPQSTCGLKEFDHPYDI